MRPRWLAFWEDKDVVGGISRASLKLCRRRGRKESTGQESMISFYLEGVKE